MEESSRQSARAFVLTPQARQQGGQDEAIEETSDALMVPLLGKVPAGNPVLAVEERIGSLRVSLSLVSAPSRQSLKAQNLFALQATGDSMIGAGILDGDFLVVKVNNEPRRGSIVVARMDGDVTVKRLMHETNSGWYLQPENPRFANIYASEEPFELIGEVVALQRSLT